MAPRSKSKSRKSKSFTHPTPPVLHPHAAGIDLEKTEGTPIGVNCRLCERENCAQRAEPPITRTLILDETTRRVSSFAFSNAREL